MSNTPIISFIEENSDGELDYSDHRMVLHRKDNGDVSIKYLGQAIGLIPETNNAQWEKRVSDSGEELDYLTVEGLLWTKWDDPIDIIKRKGITSQSMELADDYKGHWNDEGYFVFEDFSFFGACLLGEDVSPAMENSTAELQFSLDNNIQKIVEKKLKEFNTLFSASKGGKYQVENTNLDNTVATEEEVTNETDVVTEVFEDAQDDVKKRLDANAKTGTQDEETTDTDSEKETEVEVVTTDAEETQNDSGDDSEAVSENDSENSETTTNESVDSTDGDASFSISEDEFKSLKKNFDLLETEVAYLREYKRNRELTDLKDKFSSQVSEQEFTSLVESKSDATIDDLELEIYALIGKKNYSLDNKTKQNKVSVVSPKKSNEEENPYGDIFK